ncbi:MAG: ring-cleaving dioxygenase [Haloarculaceae archaeon]
MPEPLGGIHHVTAVSSEPGGTVAFYRDVLGLRLVKVTVNFDDTETYHLYFGNETGDPGTSLTFFPFGGPAGQSGVGGATATAFAVPPDALAFWTEHLATRGVAVDGPLDRFGERVCRFRAPDGLPLELVETGTSLEPWAGGSVPEAHAIRGFHGVTLTPTDATATGSVLETMGFRRTGEESERLRYEGAAEDARVVDLLAGGDDRHRAGAGTVHHVAFRVPDEAAQDAWREELSGAGLRVTPPKERHYFRSIYFRAPGGVLFELATEGPGFTADEAVDDLGSALQLPPWLADRRDSIEAGLRPIDLEDPARVGAGREDSGGAESGIDDDARTDGGDE